jgi:hypothetical protein
MVEYAIALWTLKPFDGAEPEPPGLEGLRLGFSAAERALDHGSSLSLSQLRYFNLRVPYIKL